MEQPIKHLLILLAAAAFVPLGAHAQGTAFTYQGQLNDGGRLANGAYDVRFILYDNSAGGNQQGPIVTNTATAVSNGLFTAALDFGNQFPGASRWLEMAVRTHGSSVFTTLSPRQALTPTPYAITAAHLNGPLSSANLSGTYASTLNLNNEANSFSGNGANLTALNASQLTSGTVPAARLSANVSLLGASIESGEITDDTIAPGDLNLTAFNLTFWRPVGNAGTMPGANFIGTTDNQALEFKVNNQRGLRLEPTASNDTVNVIGGSARNSVGAGVVGATIAGGGSGNYAGGANTNRVDADFGTVSGGYLNLIRSNALYATIGGGALNTIQPNAFGAVIDGGGGNNIQTNAGYTTIGGGYVNTIQANAYAATLGGGEVNTIQTGAVAATIGGGGENTIQPNAHFATIPGGVQNSAADNAFAAGTQAKANHTGAFVWADATGADFASTANNQFSIRASGGVRLSDSTPAINFGSETRQMLNLWGTQYGIGVQDSTVYFRTDTASPGNNGFAWYRGGVHNDALHNAGGGIEMMRLLASGLYVNGAIVFTSDRNAKENFKPVDPVAVLDKVAALPLSEWNYKQDTATRHLGPMAQDFHAAFGVGPDDKYIATVDADGVALAAIQGLNQKVEEKEARIAELERRLEKLERLMNRENGGAR